MKDKKYSIETSKDKIEYTLVRSNRKTIGIKINEKGEVKVTAPFFVSEKDIFQIVDKKAEWIIQKVKNIKMHNVDNVEREFISGDKFLYLGKEYSLEVVEKDVYPAEMSMTKDTFTVSIPPRLPAEDRKLLIKETMLKWYKMQFTEIVKDRIEKYGGHLKVVPCKVVIKDQKTRWGSCSSKGNINLNWRLVMAPIAVIDYVVVHELCHLKIMNHSQEFWNLVKSTLPNALEGRQWLKTNGYRLLL